MITDKQIRVEILCVLRHQSGVQGSVVLAAAADELQRLWKMVDELRNQVPQSSFED